MKSIFNLQMKTIFSKAQPYLISFVFTPFIFFTLTSYFSVYAIIIPVMFIGLTANIFFVFGPNYIETKNSVVFKRINNTSSNKYQFLFISSLIAIVWSVCSVYCTIWAIDWANYFYALLVTGDINTSFINQTFSLFFVEDLISILDDKFWRVLFDHDSAFNIFMQNELFGTLFDQATSDLGIDSSIDISKQDAEKIADYIYNDLLGWSNGLQTSLDIFIDFAFSRIDPEFVIYLEENTTITNPIGGLDAVIDFYDRGALQTVWYDISEYEMNHYEDYYEHAPYGIITYVLIGGDDPLIVYPFSSSAHAALARTFVDFRWFEWTNNGVDGVQDLDINGTRYANDSGFYVSKGVYSFEEELTNRTRVLAIFMLFFLLGIIVNSMSLLLVSFVKTYEQYSYTSAILMIAMLLLSGSIIQIQAVYSSQIGYFASQFLPSTNVFILLRVTNTGQAPIPYMTEFNVWVFLIIPITISVFYYVLSSKIYLMNDGAQTRKWDFDKKTTSWLSINIAILSVFMILSIIMTVDAFAGIESSIDGTATTKTIIVSQISIMILIVLIAYFVLYLRGYFTYSKKRRYITPALALFADILLLSFYSYWFEFGSVAILIFFVLLALIVTFYSISFTSRLINRSDVDNNKVSKNK